MLCWVYVIPQKAFSELQNFKGGGGGGGAIVEVLGHKNLMETQHNKISSTLPNLNFLPMVSMKSMAECHLTYFHLVIRRENASRKL